MQTCACQLCGQICNACDKFETLGLACVQCIHNALADNKCAEGDDMCRQSPTCYSFLTCAYGCQ